MSKWRPTPTSCLYVIADVHGKYDQLKLIFNRILPLRKTDGIQDKLIMLGDYIDRHPDSHKVIDLLIKAKKKQPDQIILLRGNHELMFMNAIKEALKRENSSDNYLLWMQNGGEQTLSGYLKRANASDFLLDSNPYIFPRFRIPEMIPGQHIEFFSNLINSYKIDNYIFAHAGYDFALPFSEQDPLALLWGNKTYSLAKYIKKNNIKYPWEETLIIGHYWHGPFISENLMMLDLSGNRELLVVELNSMEAFIAKPNKKKLVKFNLEKFV